jgi:hypothetical protein
MAFCPECGKAVTAEADNCGDCGNVISAQAKKAGAARFKGTVMMAAPVQVARPVPANANTGNAPGKSATPITDRPPHGAGGNASVTSHTAAGAQASAASVTPRIVGVSAPGGGRAASSQAIAGPAGQHSPVKATMIGAGIAPPILRPAISMVEPEELDAELEPESLPAAPMQPVQQAAHVPAAPAQPARPIAAVRAVPAVELPATSPRLRQVEHNAAAAPEKPAPRYLPGDPMAPQPSAAASNTGNQSQRLRLTHETAYALPKNQRNWLYWALGAVVLLSILLLAIGLL